MSVEQAGAKGYEYQYLITLELVLQCLDQKEVYAYVENDCFEDAEIGYHHDDNIFHIDLQVKHKKKTIELKDFCTWLAHFQKRSTDVSMFEQLEQDQNYLIFVSDGRCSDRVSKFLWNDRIQEEVTLTKGDIEEIRKGIIDSFSDANIISQKRREHMEKYLNTIDTKHMEKILKKVRIRELQKEDVVKERICRWLRNKCYVPESECFTVLEELLDSVRHGRDGGNDIVPFIMDIISRRSGRKIMPVDEKYYERKDYECCKKILEEKNVLLLTGLPFAGKTYIAKAIAQIYQNQGFQIRQADDLCYDREAYYFLQSTDNDLRVLLLEDPYGQISVKEDVLETKNKVDKLIREYVSGNRKMIITTRKDILFEAFHKRELKLCSVRGNEWVDISIKEEEAYDVWIRYFGDSLKSISIYKKLKQKMGNDSEFLEVGEIATLYAEYDSAQKLDKIEIEEIIRTARISAEEVSERVTNYGEDYSWLFAVLGLFCTNIRRVSMTDLAYILSDDRTETGVSLRDFGDGDASIIISEERTEREVVTVYGKKYKLKDDILDMIKRFHRAGYIHRYSDNYNDEIAFTHPIYYYASQLLIQREIEDGWKVEELKELFLRAIYSLSSDAAKCVLNCLDCNFKLDEFVVQCFQMASNSIFPSVRDAAVLYLDKHFEELSVEVQNSYMNNINETVTAEDYLLWVGDTCRYQKKNSYRFSFSSYIEEMFGENINISDINEKLKIKKGFTKKEIYNVLYNVKEKDIPFEFLKKSLLCEEAVIRRKAIYIIFSYHANEIENLNENYLSSYESYSVVYEIIKGALDNWNSYNMNDREQLIQYIVCQMKRKSVTFYMQHLMETFDDEYRSNGIKWDRYSETEKKEVWRAWARIYSKWLEYFPIKYTDMDSPHMYKMIRKSLHYLGEQPEVVQVGKAWLNWIREYAKIYSANDYNLGGIEYILEGTREKPELRTGIVSEVLMEDSTTLLLGYLKSLLENWNILANTEKKNVCVFLVENNREDFKWIKALAIIQNENLLEIQKAVFGEEIWNKSVEDIVDILEKQEILEEVLSIQFEFPAILSQYGYANYENRSKWNRIMLEVIKRKKHDNSYYIALREWIHGLYHKVWKENSDEMRFYKRYVQDDNERMFVFERLAFTALSNQDNKLMWDILLEASSEEQKVQYFSTISGFVELMEYWNDSYGGLFAEFCWKDIATYLLPHLPDDEMLYAIYIHFHKLSETDREQQKIFFSILFLQVYRKNPPRLSLTTQVVEKIIADYGIKSPDLNIAISDWKKNRRKRQISIKHEFREACPLKINDDNWKLRNWNE